MLVSSITYESVSGGLFHGRLAVRVGVAGDGYSPLPARDALQIILAQFDAVARPWIVIVDLYDNADADGDVNSLMEGLHHFQFTRIVRLRDTTTVPPWLAGQTTNRSFHLQTDITSAPHLRLQAGEVIYHMADLDDDVTLPNEPGKSALYVSPGPAVSLTDVREFIITHPHPWGMWDDRKPLTIQTLWRPK